MTEDTFYTGLAIVLIAAIITNIIAWVLLLSVFHHSRLLGLIIGITTALMMVIIIYELVNPYGSNQGLK